MLLLSYRYDREEKKKVTTALGRCAQIIETDDTAYFLAFLRASSSPSFFLSYVTRRNWNFSTPLFLFVHFPCITHCVHVPAISCGARACASEKTRTRPCAWQRTRISELRTTCRACIAPVLADVLINQRRTGWKIENKQSRNRGNEIPLG